METDRGFIAISNHGKTRLSERGKTERVGDRDRVTGYSEKASAAHASAFDLSTSGRQFTQNGCQVATRNAPRQLDGQYIPERGWVRNAVTGPFHRRTYSRCGTRRERR